MRWTVPSIVLLSALAAALPAEAQPAPAGPGTEAAEAVRVSIEVEQALFEEDLGRYEQLARIRSDRIARLARLYRSLDDAVREGDGAAPGRLSQLMDQIEEAEGNRTGLLTAERVLVERMETRLRTVALLQERIASLEGREREKAEGTLSGTWDLVLLPLEQRGTCVLQQSGALVSGTYRMDGGWSGSLQGTLVNRKVFLVRIDSKLGKSMEFEGYLSSDGNQIRGSWLNYELAGSDGSTGQWSARRRSPAGTQP